MPGHGAAAKRRAIAAPASLLLCLAVVGCQSDSGGSTGSLGQDRVEYLSQFKKIDSAGKGRITLDQASAYYAGLFRDLDANRDGMLDKNELQALVPLMGARNGEELLSKLDRNWDGKVSASEFQVIVNWLFQPSSSGNELTLADVQTGTRVVGQAASPTGEKSKDSGGVQRQGGIPGKR